MIATSILHVSAESSMYSRPGTDRPLDGPTNLLRGEVEDTLCTEPCAVLEDVKAREEEYTDSVEDPVVTDIEVLQAGVNDKVDQRVNRARVELEKPVEHRKEAWVSVSAQIWESCIPMDMECRTWNVSPGESVVGSTGVGRLLCEASIS